MLWGNNNWKYFYDIVVIFIVWGSMPVYGPRIVVKMAEASLKRQTMQSSVSDAVSAGETSSEVVDF